MQKNLMGGYLSLAVRLTTPREIPFIWLSILDVQSLIAVTASESASSFLSSHDWQFLFYVVRCIGLDVGFRFRILTQGHHGWNQTLACRQNDGPAMITLMVSFQLTDANMKNLLSSFESSSCSYGRETIQRLSIVAVVGQNKADSTLGTSAPVADRIGGIVRGGSILCSFGVIEIFWNQVFGGFTSAHLIVELKLLRMLHLASQDCMALLAYEEPAKSSVGYLLNLAQREAVADAVNAMVLSTNPGLQNPEHCLQSSLEKLLRQLTACCLERRLLNGEQGEIFCLHKILHGSKEALW
eukprot:Gb_37591 [translate_table: standard]